MDGAEGFDPAGARGTDRLDNECVLTDGQLHLLTEAGLLDQGFRDKGSTAGPTWHRTSGASGFEL